MLIRIKYPDGRFDMVKASQLNRLIGREEICSFLRRDGWVALDSGRLRCHDGQRFYLGSEKRWPTGV